MKKDNTIYYILGAGALIGGGYYAYKKGLLDKILGKSSGLDLKAINEENKLAAKENQVDTSYTPMTNPNSFSAKVSKIQQKIGADPDGKVGPQTNSMFAAQYGLDKGPIKPDNIDYYLGRIAANNTLAQIQALKEKATQALNKAAQANASVAQKLAAFKTAFNAGAKNFSLVTGYNAPVKLFNAAGGGLVDTKQTKNFSAGRISATNVQWGTNTASLSNDGGKTFYTFPIALLVLNK